MSIHGAHRIACGNTSRSCGAIRRRNAKTRFEFGHARHENQPIQKNGQQQIGDRPGSHDERPPSDRLAVECAGQIFYRHFPFTFIDHFDVAAQRKHADGPFRPVPPYAP